MGRVNLVEIKVESEGGVDCVVSGGTVIVRLVSTEMKNIHYWQRNLLGYFGTKQTLSI